MGVGLACLVAIVLMLVAINIAMCIPLSKVYFSRPPIPLPPIPLPPQGPRSEINELFRIYPLTHNIAERSYSCL